jgi:hypothetical protein
VEGVWQGEREGKGSYVKMWTMHRNCIVVQSKIILHFKYEDRNGELGQRQCGYKCE